MTTRVRSFVLIILAFVLGFTACWIFTYRSYPSGTKFRRICIDMAREVSQKCHEAESRREIFEKKFPENSESKNNKVTDAALKSQEWERAVAWAQACNDAKAQLEEVILDEKSDL